MESLGAIFTAHLYPKLERALIELLRSLSRADWERQTIAPKWKVHDVVAHLLDTQLRRLSMVRDGYLAETPNIASNADLVAFVNRLNHEGVTLYRRLSPRVLVSLMEVASRECGEYFQSIDPFGRAQFSVSWAGESESENWFDTAREFTERWHHQQQIRMAVCKPGIVTREFYSPVLDTFMRALPFHYREVESPPGVMAQFKVSGECGGMWYLFRDEEKWRLTAHPLGERVASTTIPQEIAWRLFTKGIDREAASEQVEVDGDPRLGLHVLNMLTIIG
ncbi:MAG TPA: maleylpyruvate isomerase N-terminal domain-containing protein [Blastocatellia bacterium]|nr:maleylpyruvate isomerase N-terminal domain-containing protein [Blastocatellia bacterium]